MFSLGEKLCQIVEDDGRLTEMVKKTWFLSWYP
jgi:hypothetical protein